ncbi:MAG: TIGR04150 pseudo-rSAM protein [Bacteroidales bacterium]|jgi:pseudo-rSAM protein|nr:TIGR04150 pseudo-rSAM protein [Bacteroidales bacterium]
MENQEKFWLFIKPHVYVSKEENKCMLLYNTQNGEFIETARQHAINTVNQLHERQNLGTILMEKKVIDSEIETFIREAEQKKIFGIMLYSEKHPRPVQLMPVLNIQKDIEKLRKDTDRSIGEDTLHYLTELTLYVNDDCSLRCRHCKEAYKQVNFCIQNNTKFSIDLPTLQSIAKQIQYAPIGRLNIIGGNIFKYPLLENIVDIFDAQKEVIHCWSHYRNFQPKDLDVNFDIWVDFPVSNELLKKCLCDAPQDKTTFHFLIKNTEDVVNTEEIIEEHNLANTELHPFYTGENIEFFEDNIFLNREDIFSEIIEQRKIFCNQAFNFHNFGKLIVSANGDVFANINAPKLGNVKENSFLELLYKELDENTAWRKTRTEKPCDNCLYQYLCPPTSNYEFVIGKPNLCTVKS